MRMSSSTYVSRLGVGVAALLLAVGAARAQADDLDGATLYATKTCIACHGADAKSPILPEYPKLAGQNEAYILQQMKDIKSGARTNGNTAAMAGVMHLVNEAEIEVLSKYIAGLTP